jgi:hypothetical protein
MKSSSAWTFGAWAFGLVLGAAGAAFLSAGERARSAGPRGAPGAIGAPRAAETAALGLTAGTRESSVGSEAGAPPALVTEALRAHARRELERAYREACGGALPPDRLAKLLASWEGIVLTTPTVWGRNEGEADAEDAAALVEDTRGPPPLDPAEGIAWLDGLERGDPPATSLAADGARYGELFQGRSSGRAHDGPSLTPETPLADGALLSYPAGVFRVSDLAHGRDPFPSDVTLRGAGMDVTLLVMEELRPRGPLERFTIEDCTVFAEGGITDVRAGKSILALRRLRLVGFDCGAGGSCALYLDGCALSAEQCRFEGGYGRSPTGFANLLRSPEPLLASRTACSSASASTARWGRPSSSCAAG